MPPLLLCAKGNRKRDQETERERERERERFVESEFSRHVARLPRDRDGNARVSKQTAHPVHICAFIPFTYLYVECFELDQTTEGKRPGLLTRIYLPIKFTWIKFLPAR